MKIYPIQKQFYSAIFLLLAFLVMILSAPDVNATAVPPNLTSSCPIGLKIYPAGVTPYPATDSTNYSDVVHYLDFSWGAVAGADNYAIRIDRIDTYDPNISSSGNGADNGNCGDLNVPGKIFCATFNSSTLSYRLSNIDARARYVWWVHAIDGGVWSGGASSYGPAIQCNPNCSDIRIISGGVSGLTNTVYLNEPSTFRASAESLNGLLAGSLYVNSLGSGIDIGWGFNLQSSSPTTKNYDFDSVWTPTSTGSFTIGCRMWDGNRAECRHSEVDRKPRYLCAGPNSGITVNVIARPTNTPTPYINIYVRDPSGNAVSVPALAYDYSCHYPQCYGTIATNTSDLFTQAYGSGGSAGGSIVLNSNQRIIDYSSTPSGAYLSDYTCNYSWCTVPYVGATWNNLNWSSYPYSGGRSVTFVVATVTPAPTNTPVVVATATSTKAPTITPTKIPTITPTNVPSNTPTKTPSLTLTPTRTPTKTPTITPTHTSTPTRTPTKTATPTPTPTIPPEIHIIGDFRQVPNAGSAGPIPASISQPLPVQSISVPNLSTSPTNCYTTTCVESPENVAYNCTLEFAAICAIYVPQSFNVAGFLPPALLPYYENASSVVNMPVPETEFTIPLDFKYKGGPWIKLKDTSFMRYPGATAKLTNNLPYIVDIFDGEDSGKKGMIDEIYLGGGGFVAGDNNFVDIRPLDVTSQFNNYRINANYTLGTDYTDTVSKLNLHISKLLNYKAITTTVLNAGSDLNLVRGQIYVVENADINVDEIFFSGSSSDPTLLIIKNGTGYGTLRVNTNINTGPNFGPLAIIAGDIFLGPSVTETRAIVVSVGVFHTADSGYPLKIFGNLLALKGIDQQRERGDFNNAKPSVFVVQDPNMYIGMLPLISINETSY